MAAVTPVRPAQGVSDAEIIRRSCAEPECFSAIFDRYYAQIHGYAARRLGQSLADDVAAETFLIAFTRRERYEISRPDARAWLYGIASNLIARHHRAEHRRYRALARTGAGQVSACHEDDVAVRLDAQAYRTAAVAAAGPVVRPGQWVYWQEEFANGTGRAFTYDVWTTADSRQAAYRGGKIHTFKPGGCGGSGGGSGDCGFAGQPVIVGGDPNRPGAVSWLWYATNHLGVSYAALRFLPHNPQALDRYLSHLNAGAWKHSSAPVREFMIISDLLLSYVMPPALTAELYHGLGDIPGVTVDRHAVDVAGRTGVGFRIRPPRFTGSMVYELIVNPHTYRLMASQGQAAGQKPGGIAILRRVPVSGPGVRP